MIAFGFILQITYFPWSIDSASVRHSVMVVFPAPAGPTSMIPCLTKLVSYSWMHLLSQGPCFCKPFLSATSHRALWTSGNSALGALRPMKRSSKRERKRGTSSATNLDMFMSLSVLIIKKVSDLSGLALLDAPAVLSTERMFLRPKS